ncbi:MAG: sialidase family protein, partial [Myxococcota bacterium]
MTAALLLASACTDRPRDGVDGPTGASTDSGPTDPTDPTGDPTGVDGGPVRIDGGGGDPGSASAVTTCADGGPVYAVWVDDSPASSGAVWLNRFDADGWLDAPVSVDPEPKIASAVEVQCEGDRVWLVWASARDAYGDSGIWYQQSDDAGDHWLDAPVPVDSDPDGASDGAYTSVAGRGDERLVVWADDRSGVYDILAARSVDGGRHWQRPVRVDAGDGYSARPKVAFGDGDLRFVAWEDSRNAAIDVYVARSIDGGDTFLPDIAPSGTPGGPAEVEPVVCVDEAGAPTVAWSDAGRDGASPDVWAGWSPDDGATWEPHRVDDRDDGQSLHPRCLSDGGGIHLAWDEGPGEASIAHRRVVDGAPSGPSATV